MEEFGGCLCGAVRFSVDRPPDWVTMCCCTFCQRVTGTAMVTEPIFARDALIVTTGTPSVFVHVSEGSGQEVHLHFCAVCGSNLYLTFARWPDRIGVYQGAFDRPDWFPITPENSKYIFTGEAPRGTMFPAGFKTFPAHAATRDGAPLEPVIFDAPHRVP